MLQKEWDWKSGCNLRGMEGTETRGMLKCPRTRLLEGMKEENPISYNKQV